MKGLFAALCLMAVLEGLFLFAAPLAWKRMVEQLHALSPTQLRTYGAVVMFIGLGVLWLVRQ
ncbi:MAG: DUF2065 domain-containing protein [Pseudoxanthomonas sp.]